MRLKSTYKVKIEIANEGSFTCIFKRRKQNESLKDSRELAKLHKQRLETEDTDERIDLMTKELAVLSKSLVSIDGLENEDGTPVTAEQFLQNELYEDITLAVLRAHGEYVTGKNDAAKKKKESD
jgi:hypothetical protein